MAWLAARPAGGVAPRAWQNYFEPLNFVAGGVLLIILGIYFQGHVPLAESGPVWKFASGAEWLGLYPLFLAFELSPVLMLLLTDRRHAVLGELRPLVYAAAGLLLLLPLYKFGFASDLRLEAAAPALLFAALGAARCWQSAVFSPRRPMFLLLAAAVLLGAVYPLLRPWQNLLFNPNDFSYAKIVEGSGFTNLSELRYPQFNAAAQYLGQTNSAAARWLLR